MEVVREVIREEVVQRILSFLISGGYYKAEMYAYADTPFGKCIIHYFVQQTRMSRRRGAQIVKGTRPKHRVKQIG